MKCFLLATSKNEECYPLTREVPAGLLDMKGKPCLEWVLEELCAMGENVSCEIFAHPDYEKTIKNWAEQQSIVSDIRITVASDNANLWENVEKESDDVFVFPADFIPNFSIANEIEALRKQPAGKYELGYGKDKQFENFGVYWIPKETLVKCREEGIHLEKEEAEPFSCGALCAFVKDLETYDALQQMTHWKNCNLRTFDIQAFTQQKWGNIFISHISMKTVIIKGEWTYADVTIENHSEKPLTPENTKIRYRALREEAEAYSYKIEKIPVAVPEPVELTECIQPGEKKVISVKIQAPNSVGKYYLRLDLSVDGQWLADQSPVILFPSVSFLCEYPGEFSLGMLMGTGKLILTGTPEGPNAGEHLEAAAMREFMQELYPQKPVLEYTFRELEQYWEESKRIIHKEDLVVSYSYGYIGKEERIGEEYARRKTASKASWSRILVPFLISPSHNGFSNEDSGKQEMQASAMAYQGNNYLIYGASEEDCSAFAEGFPKAVIGKAPLFSYGKKPVEDREPKGGEFTVVVCGGSPEGFLESTFDAIDSQGYHRMYLNLDYNAYEPGKIFGKTSRQFLIDYCCNIILDTRAVVTDSYYGLAYALMCNRPCVVYGQSQDKEWFLGREDVVFVDELGQIKEAIAAILSKKAQGPLEKSLYDNIREEFTSKRADSYEG